MENSDSRETPYLGVHGTGSRPVQILFNLYDELACLSGVQREATRRGLRSKRRVSRAGTVRGDSLFSRGQIHHLLTNPACRGLIRHKEKCFPGQHSAIVPEDLWDRVQDKFTTQSARRRDAGGREGAAPNGMETALLLGKFRDEADDLLTPTHAQKRGRRYRYYVSHRLIADGTDATGWRLPAPAFEKLVGDCLARQIENHATSHRLSVCPEAATAVALAARGTELAVALRAAPDRHLARLLRAGRIARDRLILQPDIQALAAALGITSDDLAPDLAEITAPLTLRRRGVEARLISGSMKPAPDRTLIHALAQAHRWTALLREGLSFVEIARRDGKDESFVRARTQLAFLAPPIQTRILEGTLPPEIALERLVRNPLPFDWAAQARALGL